MYINKHNTILCLIAGLLWSLACASSPGDEEYGFSGYGDEDPYENKELEWREANLTWFESYPDPGSEECIAYNGCTWAGHFAFFEGVQQTEEWIANTHIAAVHSDDYPKYKGKILRVRQGSSQIDVRVYDMCSDNDCSGCCTRNSASTGFLIDMEVHTLDKFGSRSGVVEWACLNC